MSLEVDYLPVATASGASVDSQSTFSSSTYQQNGFVAGIAEPTQINKIMRQSSMVAAAVANFISDELSIDVLDDGDLTTLIANLINAISSAAKAATTGVVSVAYSATPVFDASLGTTFEIALTGDVTSSTLTNLTPGQRLTFIIKQDATGGHAFTAPTTLPMATIDGTASSINIQKFIVDSASNVYVDSPLTVN